MQALQEVQVIDGKYQLLRELGRGSAGTVWEAEHLIVGKRVAVKILHESLARDAGLRGRIVSEARAAARIAHPHVVDIHDLGVTRSGAPYLVMELLEGESLEAMLERRHSLPSAHAVELVLQVLGGLAAAHALGIVHGDLKPANVIVTHPRPDRPHCVVLDFGVARSAGDHDGLLWGTLLYMSPEQAQGAPADARSDLYAAALLLFELVTGRTPHEPGEPHVVQSRIARGERKSIATLAPNMAPQLARVIEQALAQEPDDRPQTARDFAARLTAAVQPAAPVSLPAGMPSDPPVFALTPRAQMGIEPTILLAPDVAGDVAVSVAPKPVSLRDPSVTDSLLAAPRFPRAPSTPSALEYDSLPPSSRLRLSEPAPPPPVKGWASAVLLLFAGFAAGLLVLWVSGALPR